MWVVCHGGVKLVHSDLRGHEDVLAICGPGTVFGHDELLAGTHRTTAAAVQDGVVASMRRTWVLSRMEQDADFARQLYGALADWSAQLVWRTAEACRGTGRQRLARLLLRLADQFGAPTPEGVRTTIFLQRREIAGLIGSEPETVTRLLGSLLEDGVVRELRRGEFLLLDPARLRRMAHV
jgi:CRP-like cAMP-binding protein